MIPSIEAITPTIVTIKQKPLISFITVQVGEYLGTLA
jgi:hypothetical protein